MGFGERRPASPVESAVTKAHDPAVMPSPDRVKRMESYGKTWALLEVGTLDLPAGRTALTISARAIPHSQAMELKAARLTRLGGPVA